MDNARAARARIRFALITLALLLSPCFWASPGARAAAPAATQPSSPLVPLARGGKAVHLVVLAESAPARTRAAAQTLADYLTRISGAKFTLSVGDGQTGIAVGTLAQFPNLGLEKTLNATGLARREQYLLRSHSGGLYVIAAEERGLEDAVWDLLYRLGYRSFFPGANWEVIPQQADLSLAVDALERPDFAARRIWYSYGTWPENKAIYEQWCRRNRLLPGFALNTGHAYGGFIAKNKEAFAAHPEYYALVNGQRNVNGQAKLCIGNPDLRRLIVATALKSFAADPALESVSLDPSDGGGWCECEPCAALGSISDQALTLANEVAQAITAQFGPEKFVGMYAYNQHAPPPTIRVHPNVIMSVATAFLKGGRSFNQVLQGWKEQGSTLFGVREYYSIIHWDHDLPGQAKAGNPLALAATIAQQQQLGACFLSAESSENFGPNGLGYYIASRVMWDADEGQRAQAIIADFLDKAFGPAQAPMREYYRLIDGASKPLLSEDLLGRMYRSLDAAWKLSDDRGIRGRISDLILYTRYLELYHSYTSAQGPQRQQFFEALIRHVYRMRSSCMVHSLAIYRTGFRDKSVKIPPEASWQTEHAKNPWKFDDEFADAIDLGEVLRTGIAHNQLLTFHPIEFSKDLVKPDALGLTSASPGPSALQSRGRRRYYTWVDEAPAVIRLRVTDGLIAHYRDRGDAVISLTPADEAEGKIVAEARIAPDGQGRDIELATEHTGLHYLDMTDGMDSSAVERPRGMRFTAALNLSPRYDDGEQLYFFYVPRGTKSVAGFAAGVRGTLQDGGGTEAYVFGSRSGYFDIPVPAGQDGKLWSFRGGLNKTTLMFMTVPPYLARSGEELLLPREVVEADAPKP